MTTFKDNIGSGNIAVTSALSNVSWVSLTKTFNFNAIGGTTAITRNGVFPPNTQNLSAELFIVQNASATVSNKITVSCGGTNLLTIDQFGSAGGVIPGVTVTGVGRYTVIASAAANPPAPATGQANGGEIPFAVTFLPVSADKTGSYQLCLTFNRADTTWGSQGPYAANSFV